MNRFKPASRAEKFMGSVWSDFTALSNKHNAINLGQGFPNYPVADYLKNAACAAIHGDLNQYAHTLGLPRLRKAIADNFSPLFRRSLDMDKEILVTLGASEGTFCIFQAIIEPDDEVILIEPFYDMYAPSVTMPHGKPVYVPLRPDEGSSQHSIRASDWKLNMNELKAAITPRTKALLVNTPHNPIGKVFTKQELESLAKFAIENDLIVISDEVYERLVYDSIEFTRIATLPGMWERTLTIGSAGKTFAVTGWKLGWVIGPEHIMKYVANTHNKVAFCVPTPLQEAIAIGFEREKEHNFFQLQCEFQQRQREKLLNVLNEIGLPHTIPEGSYFVLINIEKLKLPMDFDCGTEKRRDWQVCHWLIKNIGVAAIPSSVFYSENHSNLGSSFIRLCFSKTDETLNCAAERLLKLKAYM